MFGFFGKKVLGWGYSSLKLWGGLSALIGWVLAQDLRTPPRCTGPECAERLRTEENRPRRRASRRVEQRVDRFGRPKPSRRAERFRPFVYSPRHKPMERWEAFRPYEPSVRHSPRAERFNPQAQRRQHKSLARAERFALPSPRRKHNLRQAERQQLAITGPSHRQRAEKFAPPSPRRKHNLRQAERQQLATTGPTHRQRAEKQTPTETPIQHPPRAERFGIPLPFLQHNPKRAERHLPRARVLRHRKTPQNPCEPPPILHRDYAEAQSCTPRELRRRNFDRYRCDAPPPQHYPKKTERLACAPPPLRHKNFDRYRCDAPALAHYPKRTEKVTCDPLVIRHKNFDRYSCAQPQIRHRSPEAYDVPCDAQRRGVMTNTERLAHDLRYLFTNHKKHCEVVSAYTGAATGEWVNTQKYGRVPVAGVKMGWRIYVFAHFYDRKGRPLKKPRIEKRKVWAVKQLEVWVAEPAKSKKQRRYVKGLPGIEGFGGMEGMALVKKTLSVEETKAIQIEKLVRKRQIAWLVRAYPEERVRLPEWLKKYAGPKPAHFWPGVDYRLLQIW